MEGPAELPFHSEYAKTGRAACRTCKAPIDKGELKLAVMVRSPFHDGRDAISSHAQCFLGKHRPKTVGDIANFEQLRWEHQEMIKKHISGEIKVGGAATATGKSTTTKVKTVLKDFSIAYAKSGASTCQACEDKIPKAAVRVSIKDYDSEKAVKFSNGAGLDKWHHLDCFAKVREDLGFFEAGNLLPGFKVLSEEDKELVNKKLRAIKPTTSKTTAAKPGGKRKLDDKSAETSNGNGTAKKSKKEQKEENSVEEQIKNQTKTIFKYKDALKGYKQKELVQILHTNKQEIPDHFSFEPAMDRISDIMTFGALKPCKHCNGQYIYRSGVGYQCNGYISEFTKCMDINKCPERVPFKVPKDLRAEPPFDKYKYKPQDRVMQKLESSASLALENSKPKLTVIRPLKGYSFFIPYEDEEKVAQWTKKIQEVGGIVLNKKNEKLTAMIIPTETEEDKEYKPKTLALKYAERHGIPIVSEKFADAVKKLSYDRPKAIEKYNLAKEIKKNLKCDWVEDVESFLKSKKEAFEEKVNERKKRELYEKKLTSVKMKMKDGAVVDPESGLEDEGHVLKYGKSFYNCVLNRAIIEENKNSFYKLQIIEADHGDQYWVFKSWGRIGTTQGKKLVQNTSSREDAIDLFREKFGELTGNEWGAPFQKRAGGYMMLEIDYGEKEHMKLIPSEQSSQLPMPVQELVSLIFDVDRMKRAMMEFELNLEEMPLGKISRKQVLSAYSALTEATGFIEKILKGDGDVQHMRRMVLDVSNRFYSMIPHNFGVKDAPLLDNNEIVKSKLDMIESLLEIELAYEMLLEGDKGGESSIDAHYKTLNAAIDPVESGSEEFVLLEKYMKNTHADTHKQYQLEVENIFKVNRNGENKRFRPCKEMHNRKLLWHGSRITNFAGILSQGLRIAPAEAPVTGYMFGKGIYFADMVSKSANYCCASSDNNTGILLVCEVALGDMHEMKKSKDTLTKAPNNCHSVKGLGETEPDPSETIKLPDGVEVPLGKPKKAAVKGTELLYNEYIVYDVSQVNIRYLMKVNFNFTGRRR